MTILLNKDFGVPPGMQISRAWDSPIATYEMHQSQLNTLVGLCAKRFEYEHIQRIPKSGAVSEYAMSMGTASHKVVETVLSGSNKTLGQIMSEQWDQHVMPNLFAVNFDKAIDAYESNTQNALHWVRDNFDPMMVHPEKPFKIPNIHQLGEVLKDVDPRWSYAGSMDLIQLDDVAMTANIADMKFRDRSNIENNKASAQSAMYGLAAMYYGYVPRFRYVEFVRGKIIEQEIKIDQDKFEWLYIKTRQAIEHITTGFYPLNPAGWHCSRKYCNYWSICRGRFESSYEENGEEV